MNKFELEKRTKRFALRIIEFVGTLPHAKAAAVIEYQLVKAGTAVGANYREANRGESRADFIHKIAIVEKEASESCYWLELCDEAGFGDRELLSGSYKNRENYSPSSQALERVRRRTAHMHSPKREP